jgi:hypothetical protein
MRKLFILILLMGSIVPNISKANELGDIVWEKEIAEELFKPVISSEAFDLTADNGYIAVSTKRTYTSKWSSNSDIYIVKTDENGDKVWDKKIGSTGNDYGRSVITTKEGYYIILGSKQTNEAGNVSYIACLNQDGEIIWENHIGRYGSDSFLSVKETVDGGFVLTGTSRAIAKDGLAYYGVSLLFLSAEGQIKGKKVFETMLRFFGAGYSYAESKGNSILETDDGYIIAGQGFRPDSWMYWPDILITKTDKNGNLQWQKTYNSVGSYTDFFEEGYSIEPTSDGGYIVAGKNSEPSQAVLLKLNYNGNMQWMKKFGGSNYEYGYSVKELDDKGFILAGATTSYGNGASDIYLIKTDMNGNVVWEKTIGAATDDHGLSIKTIDNGFVLAGIEGTSLKLWKFTKDISPPKTILDIIPDQPVNQWFKTDVKATLIASDSESEVKETYYRINNGDWLTYGFPVSLIEDGIHSFQYYSVDIKGNIEEINTAEIKIDRSVPVTEAIISSASNLTNNWYREGVKVEFSASDNLSGIAETYYKVNEGSWEKYNGAFSMEEEGAYSIKYKSIDKAGNEEGEKVLNFGIDKTAPSGKVTPSLHNIWSPNHKFVPVTTEITFNDYGSGILDIQLESIEAIDEKLNAINNSDYVRDAEYGNHDTDFMLKAERNGKGSGRSYVITYKLNDLAGNSSLIETTVYVIHDKSKN